MANMVALNTVYNHYVTTYGNSLSAGRYDTHKKDELKDIYNRIVKMNKDAPLFLPVTGDETRAYAIGVKEGARSLHNLISSMGGADNSGLLNKKVAYSDNEGIISSTFIGNARELQDDIPTYDIEVKSLATAQTNLGSFLYDEKPALPEGTYSFDINIQNTNYEFQYNITDEDTNRSLQEKLARLINRADIGVDADIVEDEDMTSLRLISQATGTPIGRDDAFTVSDENSSRLTGSVEYFGIGDVARDARDAVLVINGVEKSVSANHFTLEHIYDIRLNGVSSYDGESVHIGVKDDTSSLTENITRLIDGYNSFVESATAQSGARTRGSHLLDEMKRIATSYQDAFVKMGYDLTSDGKLSLNDPSGDESPSIANPAQAAGSMRNFADSLLRKTNQISLDPMQYIEKIMVAYKNPSAKNYPTPYITSAYSGMLFNSYC